MRRPQPPGSNHYRRVPAGPRPFCAMPIRKEQLRLLFPSCDLWLTCRPDDRGDGTMADDLHSPTPVAGWFKYGAIASVVFMALGCASYIYHVTVDVAGLPLDQRAMMEAVPTWMNAAFAIAVWVGLAGSVMLLLRRKMPNRCCWFRCLRCSSSFQLTSWFRN